MQPISGVRSPSLLGNKEAKLRPKVGREKAKGTLQRLEEFGLHAYENAKLYKERTKKWQDKHIVRCIFKHGQKVVLLFNFGLKLFPCKLKPKCIRLFGSWEHDVA